MQIDIVTHCYAKRLPLYAKLLRLQIQSLVFHPPKQCDVRLIVCYTIYDELVYRIASRYKADPDRVFLNLKENQMFPRAIGRHLASQASPADVIWFTDVDHYFGEGCLDAVAEFWRGNGPPVAPPEMFFPAEIQISKDHATGDQQWQSGKIKESDFIPKKCKRPPGGLFITDGDYVRENGYCRDTKWQRGSDTPFSSRSADDKAFRAQIRQRDGGMIVKADIPNLYRIRHSECGRRVKLAEKQA